MFSLAWNLDKFTENRLEVKTKKTRTQIAGQVAGLALRPFSGPVSHVFFGC